MFCHDHSTEKSAEAFGEDVCAAFVSDAVSRLYSHCHIILDDLLIIFIVRYNPGLFIIEILLIIDCSFFSFCV